MPIPEGEFRIETPRLILRDFRPDDAADVSAFRTDPQTMRFMRDEPEPSVWLMDVIHHNAVRPRRAYNLAIARQDEDRAIGWIGFGPSERHPIGGAYGVGYMLASTAWGQGYATEALQAVVAYVFTDLQATDLSAFCFAANGASERVMQKAGLRFRRRYRLPEEHDTDDRLEYGISALDWLHESGTQHAR